MNELNRLLRLPALRAARGGMSKAKIYADISAGTFIRPISLGPKFVVWPENEVTALNSAAIAGKTPDEIRILVSELEAKRKLNR